MSMTLRMNDEQDAALTALAEAQGLSKNEAALRAIVAEYRRAQEERRFQSAVTDTLERYPTTIRRLGE